METKEIILNGKALYTPKGAAREYAAVGCNFYNGCPHDCLYCYLKRGVLSKTLGKTEVSLKKCFADENDALFVFKHECEKHIDHLRKTGVFFSFSTDPMLRETHMLTLKAAKFALQCGIPVKILTKCANVPLSANIILNDIEKEKRPLLAIGFTLTGRDDMEPYADSNAERIDSMKRVKELGFRTFASIEPIIDFNSSFRMIEQSAKFCDLFKIGLRSGVKNDYYNADECAFFIGRVTGLCEKEGFKVYWKKSIHDYVQKNMAADNFEKALQCSENFVGMDYNLFT